MDYSIKAKYLMIYEPLPEDDSRTYESDHCIFKSKPIQEDKKKIYLFTV